MVNNIMIKAYVWVQHIRADGIEALKNESGQDLIEYAVLAGAIGVALFTALVIVGFPTVFQDFGTSIKNCIDLKPATACP